MKQFAFQMAILVLCCLASFYCSAQRTDEEVIRDLEEREREAIQKGDTVSLSKLMSPKIVVQNPENIIVDFPKIMKRIREGKISYAAFERNIENISFTGNVAIVMGLEKVLPQGTSRGVNRRFMNIWVKENGSWKLTARQATIVPAK
jgi:ketosteroid isomerase-like protein